MTAEIIQIRDFQNKRDIDRLYQEITAELAAIESATEIANVELVDTAPSEYLPIVQVIDGNHFDVSYVAPKDDPA